MFDPSTQAHFRFTKPNCLICLLAVCFLFCYSNPCTACCPPVFLKNLLRTNLILATFMHFSPNLFFISYFISSCSLFNFNHVLMHRVSNHFSCYALFHYEVCLTFMHCVSNYSSCHALCYYMALSIKLISIICIIVYVGFFKTKNIVSCIFKTLHFS